MPRKKSMPRKKFMPRKKSSSGKKLHTQVKSSYIQGENFTPRTKLHAQDKTSYPGQIFIHTYKEKNPRPVQNSIPRSKLHTYKEKISRPGQNFIPRSNLHTYIHTYIQGEKFTPKTKLHTQVKSSYIQGLNFKPRTKLIPECLCEAALWVPGFERRKKKPARLKSSSGDCSTTTIR
jgi:hypothetical protein